MRLLLLAEMTMKGSMSMKTGEISISTISPAVFEKMECESQWVVLEGEEEEEIMLERWAKV